jgi:hypothetical protein
MRAQSAAMPSLYRIPKRDASAHHQLGGLNSTSFASASHGCVGGGVRQHLRCMRAKGSCYTPGRRTSRSTAAQVARRCRATAPWPPRARRPPRPRRRGRPAARMRRRRPVRITAQRRVARRAPRTQPHLRLRRRLRDRHLHAAAPARASHDHALCARRAAEAQRAAGGGHLFERRLHRVTAHQAAEQRHLRRALAQLAARAGARAVRDG